MIHFDAQFFDKHQKILLFVANCRYLRWLMGINRLPADLKGWRIDKISPSGIHQVVWNKRGKMRARAACFVRPRFAEALAYNLSPFVYLQQQKSWHFSPMGVIGCLLLALFPHKLGGFAFFGTTTNFYTSAGDGSVTLYNQTSWSAAQTGSAANYYDYTRTTIEDAALSPGAIRHPSGNYSIGRGCFPIDTSSIGSGATINSADLKLCTAGTASSAGAKYYNIVGTTQESATYVEADDYGRFGTTKFCTDKLSSTFAGTGSYTTWSFNTDGKGAISLTGYTKLGLRIGDDIAGSSDPGWTTSTANQYIVYSSEASGTSTDPYITIDYTASGGGSTFKPYVIFY